MEFGEWLGTAFYLFVIHALSNCQGDRNQTQKQVKGVKLGRGKENPTVLTSSSHLTACCQGEKKTICYDSSQFICCNGKLNRRRGIGEIYCCDKRLYDPSTAICCKGSLQGISKSNVNPRCCGKVAYDANELICCRKTLRNMTHVHAKCCGDKVIDVTRQMCCYGNPQPSTEGKSKCCGRISFNPKLEKCCDSILSTYSYNAQCCGNTTYDPTRQTCCNGTIHKKPGLPCCARQTYNTAENICCGGRLVPRESAPANHACCGTDIYDVTTQSCCGNITLSALRSRWRCCGNSPYDSYSQMCCGDTLHRRYSRRDRCCGTILYDPSMIRCDDFFYSKISLLHGHKCGNVVYNPDKEICCAPGHVSKKTHGDWSRCCSNEAFNARTHMCCNGAIVPIPRGIPQCCGKRPYDVTRHRCEWPTNDIASRADSRVLYCGTQMKEFDSRAKHCCGGSLYDVAEPCCHDGDTCCNRQPFNRTTHICCNGSLAHRARDTKCCGRSAYNSSRHACCSGRVYPAGFTCCGGLLYPTQGTSLALGRCCGGLGYNPNTQICCASRIFNRETNKTKCCGNRTFLPSRNLTCCHGRLVVTPYRNAICCGRKAYDPASHTCCRARIHPGRNLSCCGRNAYTPGFETCCRNKHAYPIATYGTKCCEDLAYDQSVASCVAGHLQKLRATCARFDARTHMCCAGRLRAKRPGFLCCGKRKFNTAKSLCCGGIVFSRRRFVCCGERGIRVDRYRCCEGMRPRKIGKACCSRRECTRDVVGIPEEICTEDVTVFTGSLYAMQKSSYKFRVEQNFKGTRSGHVFHTSVASSPVTMTTGKIYLVVGRPDAIVPNKLTLQGIPIIWSAKTEEILQRELGKCISALQPDMRMPVKGARGG
ncbi:uncharacterized protein LOC5520808 isoform X1 [Nematostella vectensis]|nr:uncharacterized protein LOC5520808 isoform X1 [Nematostella vectensis]